MTADSSLQPNESVGKALLKRYPNAKTWLPTHFYIHWDGSKESLVHVPAEGAAKPVRSSPNAGDIYVRNVRDGNWGWAHTSFLQPIKEHSPAGAIRRSETLEEITALYIAAYVVAVQWEVQSRPTRQTQVACSRVV